MMPQTPPAPQKSPDAMGQLVQVLKQVMQMAEQAGIPFEEILSQATKSGGSPVPPTPPATMMP